MGKFNYADGTTHVRIDAPSGKVTTVPLANASMVEDLEGKLTCLKKLPGGKFMGLGSPTPKDTAAATTAETTAVEPAAETTQKAVEEKPAEVEAATASEPEQSPVATKPTKKEVKKVKQSKTAKIAQQKSTKPRTGKTKFIADLILEHKLTADEIAAKVVEKFPESGSKEDQMAKAKRFVRAVPWHMHKKDPNCKAVYVLVRERKNGSKPKPVKKAKKK